MWAGAPALGGGAATDSVAALAGFAGPVIAAVNGAAVTGGFELALACDVLLASEEARFADTHAKVGVLPGWGLSQRLPRLVGPGRAKELSLPGNFLGARQAEAWGLVNRVLPAGELLPAARALARDMLPAAPDMLPATKRPIDDGYAPPFAGAMALQRERSRAHRARVTGQADGGRAPGRRHGAGQGAVGRRLTHACGPHHRRIDGRATGGRARRTAPPPR